MDYTAEADALHGQSPWGSSSPRAPRGFQQAGPDSPESPQPIRGHSYNQSQDSIPESPYLPPPDQSGASNNPGTTAAAGGASQHQADIAQQGQAAAHHQHEIQGQAPGQQRPGAARYHNARQNRPVPQYKLQAKVTALERTGRKDPVIRFDVYVCYFSLYQIHMLTSMDRPISQSSAPHSSATSAATHGEFVKLADHLISSNPEALVPAVPPAQTSAGVGTDEDEARVKAAIQRWLNAVCSNDVLMRDEEMVFFVGKRFRILARRKDEAACYGSEEENVETIRSATGRHARTTRSQAP